MPVVGNTKRFKLKQVILINGWPPLEHSARSENHIGSEAENLRAFHSMTGDEGVICQNILDLIRSQQPDKLWKSLNLK